MSLLEVCNYLLSQHVINPNRSSISEESPVGWSSDEWIIMVAFHLQLMMYSYYYALMYVK